MPLNTHTIEKLLIADLLDKLPLQKWESNPNAALSYWSKEWKANLKKIKDELDSDENGIDKTKKYLLSNGLFIHALIFWYGVLNNQEWPELAKELNVKNKKSILDIYTKNISDKVSKEVDKKLTKNKNIKYADVKNGERWEDEDGNYAVYFDNIHAYNKYVQDIDRISEAEGFSDFLVLFTKNDDVVLTVYKFRFYDRNFKEYKTNPANIPKIKTVMGEKVNPRQFLNKICYPYIQDKLINLIDGINKKQSFKDKNMKDFGANIEDIGTSLDYEAGVYPFEKYIIDTFKIIWDVHLDNWIREHFDYTPEFCLWYLLSFYDIKEGDGQEEGDGVFFTIPDEFFLDKFFDGVTGTVLPIMFFKQIYPEINKETSNIIIDKILNIILKNSDHVAAQSVIKTISSLDDTYLQDLTDNQIDILTEVLLKHDDLYSINPRKKLRPTQNTLNLYEKELKVKDLFEYSLLKSTKRVDQFENVLLKVKESDIDRTYYKMLPDRVVQYLMHVGGDFTRDPKFKSIIKKYFIDNTGLIEPNLIALLTAIQDSGDNAEYIEGLDEKVSAYNSMETLLLYKELYPNNAKNVSEKINKIGKDQEELFNVNKYLRSIISNEQIIPSEKYDEILKISYATNETFLDVLDKYFLYVQQDNKDNEFIKKYKNFLLVVIKTSGSANVNEQIYKYIKLTEDFDDTFMEYMKIFNANMYQSLVSLKSKIGEVVKVPKEPTSHWRQYISTDLSNDDMTADQLKKNLLDTGTPKDKVDIIIQKLESLGYSESKSINGKQKKVFNGKDIKNFNKNNDELRISWQTGGYGSVQFLRASRHNNSRSSIQTELLNIGIPDNIENEMKQNHPILYSYIQSKRDSLKGSHPYNIKNPIGWVRIDVMNDKTWLIEEIQHDFLKFFRYDTVKSKYMPNEQYVEEAEEKHKVDAEFLQKKVLNNFTKKAVHLVKKEALNRGIDTVYWTTFRQKLDVGNTSPPASIGYDKIPKELGFKLVEVPKELEFLKNVKSPEPDPHYKPEVPPTDKEERKKWEQERKRSGQQRHVDPRWSQLYQSSPPLTKIWMSHPKEILDEGLAQLLNSTRILLKEIFSIDSVDYDIE